MIKDQKSSQDLARKTEVHRKLKRMGRGARQSQARRGKGPRPGPDAAPVHGLALLWPGGRPDDGRTAGAAVWYCDWPCYCRACSGAHHDPPLGLGRPAASPAAWKKPWPGSALPMQTGKSRSCSPSPETRIIPGSRPLCLKSAVSRSLSGLTLRRRYNRH